MKCIKTELSKHFGFIAESGADPVLEAYLPFNLSEMRRENEKRPSLLICPGGGYAMCSQREAEPIALNFLSEGFNVFVLWYSNSPFRFPVQLRETAAAMKLIEERAGEWNVDPADISIMGFSAGAHLAAQYSNLFDSDEVRSVVSEPLKPRLSLLCYPVITADERFTHSGSFENLLGHFPLDENEMKKHSCELLVTEKTPPTFLFHTASDGAVPVENSLLYSFALSRNGVPFELHVYPFGQHGLATSDRHTLDEVTDIQRYDADWISEAKRWLRLMKQR